MDKQVSKDSITLAAVGDVCLASLPDNILDKVITILKEHDLRFANLEGPVSDRGEPWPHKYTFRADARHMATVKKAGFDVVTFANNHCLDYGEEAFLQTLELLDKNGIKHVGAGKDLISAQKPVILEKKGCSIAFLGYASFYHPGYQATDVKPGIAPVRVEPLYPSPHVNEEDLGGLLASIKEMKTQADVVVAAIHWGMSMGRTLTVDQKYVGHQMIDAGADIVLGSHPHILQGIELYNGKVIIYSFGNFIFGVWPTIFNMLTKETMILTCIIEDNEIRGVFLRPVLISKLNEPEVIAGDHPMFAKIFKTLNELSAPLNTTLSRKGDKIWVLDKTRGRM